MSCLLGSYLGGCGRYVEITHSILEASKAPANMTLQVGELATNVRKEAPDLVGTVTLSAAGIPIDDVKTQEPLPEIMHSFVVEALEKAGYEVVDVRHRQVARVPVLRGELKVFWFAVYTWIAPVMYYGGNIEYRLILQMPDGPILWEKTLKSSSGDTSSWNGAIRPAVTNLLNQIKTEVGTKEFQASLQQGTPQTGIQGPLSQGQHQTQAKTE